VTWRTQRSFVAVRALPEFGGTPLNKVDRFAVQAWVTEMIKTLAPRTVRDSYRVFTGLMEEAVRQGLIPSTP
jgi:hypothetical protein